MNRKSDQSILEKPSVFDPRGQSDVDPRKLFYFDPSKVLTGGVIFILPCLLLGLHLSEEEGGTGTCFTSSMTTHTTVWDV